MSGNAKKGKNKGIRCGFLNLQPESDKTSLILVKFFVTFSIGVFSKIVLSSFKKLKKFLFNHQIKKKFQFSLPWEKNQLAIWDNRSMLHQATPFKGNRIMHRITIK